MVSIIPIMPIFNGVSSVLLENNCGVPQGSVLGPLLFFIYINDLPNISKILNFYLFADESNSLNDLERTVNKELNKLYLWLNLNRLSLNIDQIKSNQKNIFSSNKS